MEASKNKKVAKSKEQKKEVKAKKSESKPKVKKGKKEKKERDPNAPKKPLTGYFLFCQDRREEAKKSNPDKKLTTADLKAAWDSLDAKIREKYDNTYKTNKAKYDEEMKAYKEKRFQDHCNRSRQHPAGSGSRFA